MNEIQSVVLYIREIPPLDEFDRMWLFLKYTGRNKSLLDFRWAIGYRKQGDWWGVVATFPATHTKGIDGIELEMKLAKQAIKILKKKYMNENSGEILRQLFKLDAKLPQEEIGSLLTQIFTNLNKSKHERSEEIRAAFMSVLRQYDSGR